MDIEKYLLRIGVVHRVSQGARLVTRMLEAGGFKQAAKPVAAIAAFDEMGEWLVDRAIDKWHTYENTFLPGVAHSQQHVKTTPYTRYSLGYLGTSRVPILWGIAFPPNNVCTPCSQNEAIAAAVQGAGPLTLTTTEDGYFGVTPDARPLPRTRLDEVAPVLAKLDATPDHMCRTFLLHGPPGSGKSVAARQIAAAVGDGSWLAVPPAQQTESVALDFVHYMRPRALILDDFDAPVTASNKEPPAGVALNLLEQARAHARVIVITANTLNGVRGALLRPGRVDEDPIYISGVSRQVVADVLGARADREWGAAAHAAMLLPAYLAELRVRVERGDDGAAEIVALAERMKAVGDR